MSKSIRFTNKKGEISAAWMLKDENGFNSGFDLIEDVKEFL
jgi:hypothetical protein